MTPSPLLRNANRSKRGRAWRPKRPLDRVCVDRMDGVMGAKSWTAYSKRTEPYYQFPPGDFDRYFATPVLLDSDSATDKLAADSGSTSSKLPFADKTRGKLEDVAQKMDSSARMGMRATSFLLLLSEYLAIGCEESAVAADMMVASLHCLDNGLRSVLDQFTRVSTSARRANVLDALFYHQQVPVRAWTICRSQGRIYLRANFRRRWRRWLNASWPPTK